MPSVYQVNKGINRPVEFKGLKGQYIWYLGGGLVILLILFAIMYLAHFNTFLCLGITALLGSLLFMMVYQMSNKYGEFGLMKKIARKKVPHLIKNQSRKLFIKSCKRH